MFLYHEAQCLKKINSIFVTYLANVIIAPLDQVNYNFFVDSRCSTNSFEQGDLAEIPTGHATALAGIMSQRLILNMREVYHRKCVKGHESNFDATTWQAAMPVSTSDIPELDAMDFNAPAESTYGGGSEQSQDEVV